MLLMRNGWTWGGSSWVKPAWGQLIGHRPSVNVLKTHVLSNGRASFLSPCPNKMLINTTTCHYISAVLQAFVLKKSTLMGVWTC